MVICQTGTTPRAVKLLPTTAVQPAPVRANQDALTQFDEERRRSVEADSIARL